MANKITLTDLVNLTNQTTAVNAINVNNEIIELGFDNTLSLDGTQPNAMGSTLDMNSNQIINLPAPSNPSSPLRLQDASASISTTNALTGTSGHAVPFLDGNNTWSGVNTFLTSTLPVLPFTQIGTGAIARTVDLKLKEQRISVLDFGAIADNVTDCTAAFAAADSAAAIANKSVWIPAGPYKISGTLTPSANAHWIGENINLTSLYMSSTTQTLFNITNTNVELEHFRCIPLTTRTSSAVTFSISSSNSYIHDITTVFNGISFLFTGSPVCILNNITTNGTVANGVDVQIFGSNIISISNSIFGGDPSHRAFAHVQVTHCPGQLQILNCNMFQAVQGLSIAPGNGQVVTLVKADTSYFDSNSLSSVNLAPTGTGIVQRISLVNCWLSGSNSNNIVMNGTGTTCDEIDIHNCEILGGTGSSTGIFATAATRLNVSNNRFFNFTGNGIVLSNCIGGDISANRFVAPILVGIDLTGTTDKFTIRCNDLSGATSSISPVSSGTNNKIMDNINYNPVGISAPVSLVSSPQTITAGPSPETHYISQSGTNTGQVSQGTRVLHNLVNNITFYPVHLGPNESYTVTWATTAPQYTKMVH